MINRKKEFLSFVEDSFLASYSQRVQDLFGLFVNNCSEKGFFVEFGALSGITVSNSYLMEKIGWNGIACEPHPDYNKVLQKNRKCFTSNLCVYDKSGETVSFSTRVGRPASSTISTFLQEDKNANDWKTFKVKTITLEGLLEKFNSPRIIDFISIDTEGSEYEILKDFPFEKFKFRSVCVEHNYNEVRTKLYNLFTKHGYTRLWEDISGHDDWYVHNDLLSEEHRIENPCVGFFHINNEIQRSISISKLLEEQGRLLAACEIINSVPFEEAFNNNLYKNYYNHLIEKIKWIDTKSLNERYSNYPWSHQLMKMFYFLKKGELYEAWCEALIASAKSGEIFIQGISMFLEFKNNNKLKDHVSRELNKNEVVYRRSSNKVRNRKKVHNIKSNETFHPNGTTEEILPLRDIEISPFEIINEEIAEDFTLKISQGRTMKTPANFISTFLDVKVCGNGIVLDRYGRVIDEQNLRPHHAYLFKEGVYEIILPKNYKEEKIITESSIIINRVFPFHIGHWIFDNLANLCIYSKSGFDLLNKKIILGYGNLRNGNLINKGTFQYQSLKAAGVELENCILSKQNEIVTVKRLFVNTPVNNFMPPAENMWDCTEIFPYLNALMNNMGFETDENLVPDRKIYLSRSSATARPLVNESKIEKYIEEKGFDIINPAKYSFEEQAKLFSSTKIAIGPAGAAFHSCIFMKPGSTILLLTPKHFQYVIPYYQTLASSLKLNLICFLEENSTLKEGGIQNKDIFWNIDLGKFKPIIEEVTL